jgi:hypothetical protein
MEGGFPAKQHFPGCYLVRTFDNSYFPLEIISLKIELRFCITAAVIFTFLPIGLCTNLYDPGFCLRDERKPLSLLPGWKFLNRWPLHYTARESFAKKCKT